MRQACTEILARGLQRNRGFLLCYVPPVSALNPAQPPLFLQTHLFPCFKLVWLKFQNLKPSSSRNSLNVDKTEMRAKKKKKKIQCGFFFGWLNKRCCSWGSPWLHVQSAGNTGLLDESRVLVPPLRGLDVETTSKLSHFY